MDLDHLDGFWKVPLRPDSTGMDAVVSGHVGHIQGDTSLSVDAAVAFHHLPCHFGGGGYLSGVGGTFSLARTLGFLPFFVLGWKISNMNFVERWLALGRKIWWVRAAAVAVFALTITILYPLANVLREHKAIAWLYNKSSYQSLGVDSVFAGGVRVGLIALAIVLCAAFLSLVPRRATIFTALGAATMYIYLLHTFVLYPLRESDILTNVTVAAPWIIGLVLASVALSFVLSSKPVLFVFRPIIQPKTPWLFSKASSEQSLSLPRVAPDIAPTARDS